MTKLPESLFEHPYVAEANSEACFKLTADPTRAAAMMAELGGGENGLTLVERMSTAKKVSQEVTLSQFVRPGLAPVISTEAIQQSKDPVFLVDNLPMIVVHVSKFGTVTAITPVVLLDKTNALERLREAYGAIKAHLLMVVPDQFEQIYIKLVESGRLSLTTPETPPHTPEEYWSVILAMGGATIPFPATIDEAIKHVRQTCRGATDPAKILLGAAIAYNYPLISFSPTNIHERLPHFAVRVQKLHGMTPVSLLGRVCTLATPKPPRPDDRTLLSNYDERFCFVLAYYDQVNRAITEWEAHKVSAHDIAQKIEIDTTAGEEIRVEEINIETLASGSAENESPTVVELVRAILLYAIRNKATDIHISQQPENMMVRFRIDGFLSHYPHPISAHLTKSVIARIKVLSDIDTQYSPIPLDGKFAMRVRDQDFDVRVATTLTGYGEKAVLRLLSKEKRLPSLEDLGFQDFEKALVVRVNDSDHGMLVVCGPTGSGKSTTLAAAIGMIDCKKFAVVTGEQPIERQILDIDQTNVTATPTNPNGLTFARFVEAALRQDPDYIIIGETRDTETAKQAVRAALTGHVVMTTLHTNSAASAPGRLIDLGVEPFLLQESLKAVCAQRLLPLVCQNCAVTISDPTDKGLAAMGMKREWFEGNSNFLSARGCSACRQTGYDGRVAIIEGYILNSRIRHIIGKEHASAEMIREEMIRLGGKSLYMQAALLAAKGSTDLLMATQIRSED